MRLKEPKMADRHLPLGFLMILGAICGTFEVILGHVGRILALSSEDLVAAWAHLGACKSKVKKHTWLKGVMELRAHNC